MIFAEKDAGSIRCCGPEGCGGWTTTPVYDGAPGSDHTLMRSGRFCIGKQCAAWTWVENTLDANTNKIPLEDRRGGCGLAIPFDRTFLD